MADWLGSLDGRLTLGNYLYADGGSHVLVSVAADVLGRRLTLARPDTALAFLATPTDVFVVPREAVEYSNRAYAQRSRVGKTLGRPLSWATRGRLLHRAYPPGADLGIGDALVPVQGPNYALAKRIQRWRATAARRDGQTVSFHVAPSTRTRSVVKNRALAAAFAGAHRFGVEVFEPGTANVLMAALLVHDLNVGTPTHDHPWQDEAYAAVHGSRADMEGTVRPALMRRSSKSKVLSCTSRPSTAASARQRSACRGSGADPRPHLIFFILVYRILIK